MIPLRSLSLLISAVLVLIGIFMAVTSHVVRPSKHFNGTHWPVTDDRGRYLAYKVRTRMGLKLNAFPLVQEGDRWMNWWSRKYSSFPL